MATLLVFCFAAVPAYGAPATWQRGITLGNGASYQGRGQGAAVPSSPLVYGEGARVAGETVQDASVCRAVALDPAKVTGKIVVCDMGVISPAEKADAVDAAGGVGLVLANTTAGPRTNDVLPVQTVHVGVPEGNAIKAYVAGTASPTASMSLGQRIFLTSTTDLTSASPSTAGQPATFTASVGGAQFEPEPIGTVAFTSFGMPLPGCGSVAVAAGKATCTFSPLVPGSYTIDAAYSGDDGFNPSSDTLAHQVHAPPASPKPPVVTKPAISNLQLAAPCARRSKAGRARVAMTMQLANPAALQIVVERAVGSTARRRCPTQEGTPPTRFRRVKTLDRGVSTAGERNLRLRLRLRPGLYRLTVRALLPDESLSRPVRAFVRVLK